MPHGSQSDPASSSPPAGDLGWLETVLFDAPGVFTDAASTRGAARDRLAWLALPLRGPTRRLVPTSRRFAAQAFSNRHDGMSAQRRLAGRATTMIAAAGGFRFAPRLTADANLVLADPSRSVIAAAAAALDAEVVSCAITLGPRRYNRKPVVQLMNPNAQTVAFLKVGADAATSAMVATESSVLDSLGRPDPGLEVPTVLWRAEWQGRAAACFSPVGRTGERLVPADSARLATVAAAVTETGKGRRDVAVRSAAPVARLRTEAVAADRSDAIQLADRIAEPFGDTTIAVAPWHGDFSPWNMISTERTTALIDWEFACDDMPVGADLLHNRVMVATHLGGTTVDEPLQQLLASEHLPELAAMDVPPDQHRLHLLLYLLELVRRDLELERRELPVTGFGPAAYNAARAIVAEAGRQ